MPMRIHQKKVKILFIVVILSGILAAWLLSTNVVTVARYELSNKANYQISLTLVNPTIKAVAADPGNTVVLQVNVRDLDGRPISGAGFKLASTENLGTVAPAEGRTDRNGKFFATYLPPAYPVGNNLQVKPRVELKAALSGTDREAALSFDIVRVPVVFIHGYKASPAIFANLKEYLDPKGFSTNGFPYNSDNGIAAGAIELDRYLDKIAMKYLSQGIQVKRFDMIGHSMGGLVARYYTCSTDYALRDNVNRIIFVSVPHRGSPLASLGLKHYKDRGIYDLIPDSDLYTRIFPSMTNKGLNSSIQVANILGEYDEVVTQESASLQDWGIKTEMFSVGDNNFTVDKLLSGKIIEAANHKVVLYNKKVFQRLEEMLNAQLPYPELK